MRVDCYQCGAAYSIPDEAVGSSGARVECPKCGHQETVRPDRSVVAPQNPGVSASGTPGHSAPSPSAPDAASAAAEDLFDFSGQSASPSAAGPTATVAGDEDPFAGLDLGGGASAAGESSGGAAAGGGRFDAGSRAPSGPPAAPAAGLPGVHLPGAVQVPGGALSENAAPPPSGYRLKKPDGTTWGPYGLDELEEMARTGAMAPGDQIAKGMDEFRLLSQYEECAHLLQTAAGNFQVRTAANAYQNQGGPPYKAITASVVILLVAGGLLVVQIKSPLALPGPLVAVLEPVAALMVERVAPLPPNPVLDDIPSFRMQIVDLGGGVEQNLKAAREKMALDTEVAYGEAELDLKRVLVADPGQIEGIARLILNAAYRTHWHPEAAALERFVSYARYLEAAAPEDPMAQLGRAAAQLMLGPAEAPEAQRLAAKAGRTLKDSIEAALVGARATNFINRREAILSLRGLQKKADVFPRVETELGLVCDEAGEFKCAEGAYRARLVRTPGHAEAAAALANLYLSVGKVKEASQVYQNTLKQDPDRVDVELQLAVIDYQVNGDRRKAAHTLDRILASRRELAEDETVRLALVHRAVLFRYAGKLDKAQVLLKEVLGDDAYHGPAQVQSTLLAVEQEDLAAAKAHLTKAAGGEAPARVISLLRALVAQADGDFDEAVRRARESAEASPGDLDRALYSAVLFAPQGKPRRAFSRMSALMEIDPIELEERKAVSDFPVGPILNASIEKAAKDLVAREPTQGLPKAAVGVNAYRRGDLGMARRAFGEAIELDPENLPAHIFLGMMAWDRKDLTTAERSFFRARESDRLAPLPLYLLGRVAERHGKASKAADAYKRARQVDPTFYPVTVRRAIQEAEAGKSRAAASALREIMITHPSSTAVRVALYKLR